MLWSSSNRSKQCIIWFDIGHRHPSCSLCSRLEMRCSKCEKVSAGRHDMADWLSAGIEAKSFSGLPWVWENACHIGFLGTGSLGLVESKLGKVPWIFWGWSLGHRDIMTTWWLRAFCWSQVHNVAFSTSWFTMILIWLGRIGCWGTQSMKVNWKSYSQWCAGSSIARSSRSSWLLGEHIQDKYTKWHACSQTQTCIHNCTDV